MKWLKYATYCSLETNIYNGIGWAPKRLHVLSFKSRIGLYKYEINFDFRPNWIAPPTPMGYLVSRYFKTNTRSLYSMLRSTQRSNSNIRCSRDVFFRETFRRRWVGVSCQNGLLGNKMSKPLVSNQSHQKVANFFNRKHLAFMKLRHYAAYPVCPLVYVKSTCGWS